ncbi:hypothetical protein N7530_012862 [Penicillium desertorum]|uniref:Uncharacterized protein n=1 Tax=Penicillium desertorum TaxID=1303715 RepID=A0A9X0BFH8_9EURO|nr:hypothetical protein N7530_012862 [Penicillium desertorum]
MPARAHHHAPDHLAGAVRPPVQGASLYGPPKAPGPWPPGKVPPVRAPPGLAASRGFASPPLHLPSTPPAGAANSPAAPTRRPHTPVPRDAASRPSPGAGGGGDRRWRMVRGDRRAGGRTARVTLPGPPP